MAAMQTRDSYTMARLLAFDYPDDSTVHDIKDEYMFGAFLVCPVTHPMSEQAVRKVYLPKGDRWQDYWTGECYNGGQWIETKVEIGRLPLYVRLGSIMPTTAPAECTAAQTGQPVTVEVYPGKDTAFTLYEDEGDNYNFEKGKSSVIRMEWNEKNQTLTIGKRCGLYEGMPDERTFIVKKGTSKKEVRYSGETVKVKM